MNQRDKSIINDIERFRVLSRDQIIKIHFSNLKKPISTCNLVLKRLQDRGYIKACKDFRPYLYMKPDSKIKPHSQKVFHFLKIADTYIDLLKHDAQLSYVQIEPKYKKGEVEPDLFCVFKKSPFFIEIQLTVYSEKVMNEKIERYENLYNSNLWRNFEWQQEGKEVFPVIVIITDSYYDIETDLRVLQFPNIESLVQRYNDEKKVKKKDESEIKNENGTIKITIK